MPNFIAKSLSTREYPLENGDAKFLWEVRGRNENMIYAQCDGEEFFITKKLRADGAVVVKGDKLSKPARISALQKSLALYAGALDAQILTQAIQLKQKRDAVRAENVAQIEEISQILATQHKKIFIEIGFGSGRHLLFQARENPDALVIGIEVYKPSIEQVSSLAIGQNLSNIALFNTDARLLLSLVPSNLIDKIFLHFPVPWDDAPHRRVVSDEFADECERVLKVGGVFELRSDSPMYAHFTCEKFMRFKNAKISIQKNVDNDVISKYEDRWRRQEKDIFDLFCVCDSHSEPLCELKEIKFDDQYDTLKVIENFSNTTIKTDEFFIHFEELYSGGGRAVVRVAFGSFNKPEHCFIKFEDGMACYFIKKPLLTPINFKAHEAIKEFLARCKK